MQSSEELVPCPDHRSEFSSEDGHGCGQVPTILGKQGGQLLAVALLVVSRTWISDRIADLNGMLS